MTEAVLFFAAVINALAAAGSAWFAFKTVRTTERTLDEQQRIREFERYDRRYEQQIAAPVREYLAALSTEWYGMLQQGLTELDALIARQASKAEQAVFVRRLTFSLRETWRRASFNLLIGAEAWNRPLSRELENARDELDDTVARILNEQVARSVPGRPSVQHSVVLAIRNHSVSVLDCVAKHAPRLEDASGPLASAGDSTRLVHAGAAPTRRVQR
jgi:hypothetical protein